MLNKLYLSTLMPKNLVYFECIFECISVFLHNYTHKYTQDTHKIHTIFYWQLKFRKLKKLLKYEASQAPSGAERPSLKA